VAPKQKVSIKTNAVKISISVDDWTRKTLVEAFQVNKEHDAEVMLSKSPRNMEKYRQVHHGERCAATASWQFWGDNQIEEPKARGS